MDMLGWGIILPAKDVSYRWVQNLGGSAQSAFLNMQ